MNRTDEDLELRLSIPEPLLQAVAERVADLALTRASNQAAAESPWLDAEGAAAYIGISRAQLYKLTAANAIPLRRKRQGQGLRFCRNELDAWLETEYEPTGSTPRAELWSSR